jgi:FtsP/CotA-like multicopper oxidase with cupredoxin domain
VYRFRVEQEGSFWYHSHQVGSEQVRRGLYGELTLLRRRTDPRTLEVPVITHSFPSGSAIGRNDMIQRRTVQPGTRVLLRIINTDNGPRRFVIGGTGFRVTAIDGTDVNGPELIRRAVRRHVHDAPQGGCASRG